MVFGLRRLTVTGVILCACSNASSQSTPGGSLGGNLSDAPSSGLSDAGWAGRSDANAASDALPSDGSSTNRGGPTTTSVDGGPSGLEASTLMGATGDAATMTGPSGGNLDAGANSADGGGTVPCDRTCLLGIMQKYLDALAARDLTQIPLATTVKYTENGNSMNLGDGLWMTASSIDPMERLDFADSQQGQVASQVVVYENGSSPVIYQVRLRVLNGQITEIEAMAVRQQDAANGFFDTANMKPQPVFLATIDPANLMTRDQLRAIVDHYIDYLDGTTNASGVPFDANCARYENGVETAPPGSFATQTWSFNVVRRYLVFDEEAGIVWGLFPFTPDATALVVGEAFKVMGGNIMMIQAVMAYMPATAWN